MNKKAISFAKQQEELLRKQLADLYGGLNASKDATISQAETRKQELLNKIEAAKNPINNQYETDSRQAYVNKMMGSNNINDLLSRMGLSSSGFGVSQQALNDNNYSGTLGNLQNIRNTGLQNLQTQALDAEKGYNTDLANINSEYLKNKLDLDRYINESARNVYDNSYKQSVDEQRYADQLKQQAFQNNLAEQRYADQLKQQAFQNNLARSSEGGTPKPTGNIINTSGGLLKYAPGGWDAIGVNVIRNNNGTTTYVDTVTNKKTTLAANINPFTGKANRDTMINGTWDPNKTFGNGYQPNNVSIGKNNYKLSSTGDKVPVYDGAGVQNIWKAGNSGKYFLWDGQSNKYIEVIKKGGNWVVK